MQVKKGRIELILVICLLIITGILSFLLISQNKQSNKERILVEGTFVPIPLSMGRFTSPQQLIFTVRGTAPPDVNTVKVAYNVLTKVDDIVGARGISARDVDVVGVRATPVPEPPGFHFGFIGTVKPTTTSVTPTLSGLTVTVSANLPSGFTSGDVVLVTVNCDVPTGAVKRYKAVGILTVP